MTNTGDSNILDQQQQQTIYRETTHSTMESVDSTKKEQEHLYYLPQLPKEPYQEQELVPHVPQDRQEWDNYLKQQ